MADRESERDRRVRELLSSDKSGNSGEQMAVLGQSQAEVQDIQSELQNHIALQRAQEDSRLRETQSITQAATGLMAMQQDDLQGQVATMNPQTQATMGKFGVKPQRSQNTTSNSSSNSSVSRSGNVTNIRNENVTHNTTNIKVTQPQIPVSQPQIPIQQVRRDDGTSKFKAWLSEMFAKQQNEAEIQRKEYRKKEWALGRTTTRLMKRIGEATSNIGNKLDPQVMSSSLGGQLKWLLMIFGATMIAKVWKPTMKFLANLESGFRAVFGLPINQDLRNNTTGTLSIIEQIKSFIGIKKGENTSLIKGIGEVFMQGIDKLIDRLKFWFEDRAKAMRSVEFPKMDNVDFGALGDVLGPAMEGIMGSFKGIAAYLGDLITVAMGGTKGKVTVAARKATRKAQESFTNTEGKDVTYGDTALLQGNGRNYMRESDFDMFGNLKGNAASTQAMSQSLISMINDRSNTGHAVEIASGVSQLFKTAENNGSVIINPEILSYLGLDNKDLVTLKGNGMLKEKQYRIIFVKPNDFQKEEMYGEAGSVNRIGAGVTGGLVGGASGAAIGAGLGSLVFPGVGTVLGGIGGFIMGALPGAAAGYGAGYGIDQLVHDAGQKGLYPKLVPAESNEMSADGSPGVPKTLWELTREGAKQVTHKLTLGMNNTDVDLTNREFYDRIVSIEENRKRKNGVSGNIIQNISDNELIQAQTELSAYNRRWHDRYESTDPNSYNMQHFYKWNTTYGNVSNLVNQGVSYLSNSMRGAASNLKGESLTPGQELSRQNYLIDRLVQEGLTVEQAAGIAANIRRESNYRTNVAGDRGTSIGIAQWHNERITAYNTKFGAKGPLKDASFPEQVEYLIWEAKQNGTWDAVRSTSSAEEAANMFERKFERSRDYQNEGNATRMRYASEALRSYRTDSSYNQEHILTNYTSQNTSAEPQYQATYFRGESPYEIVPQGGFKVSGSNIIAWIGDSHSQLGLPDTVGKIVKSKLNCEFIWGCKHGFTCNNHLKDDAYSNSSNPSEITKFSDILSKKPSIVIVELGDNDALNSNWQTGVDNLINKIKSIGAKVIWSTPIGYSTKHPEHVNRNAANNKFREYILSRSDIMSIDTGGFIGFYSNSPTVWDQYVSNDNIHWNREGYKKLGEWIGGMLTGEAVTNPRYNQADLETQSNGKGGFLGKLAGYLGTSLEYLADLLNPKSEKYVLTSPFEDFSPEGKEAVNNMMAQMNMDEYLNTKSWERLGAKQNEKGVYFEQPGGVRIYVKTTGIHNGMFGLRRGDVEFVERPDANNPGSYTGEMTDWEWDAYVNAGITSVDSFFSQYEEKTKGEGYYDYYTDKNGKMLGLNLMTVKDIQSFHEVAQSDFYGKADFVIYPKKDLTGWNIVGLKSPVRATEVLGSFAESSNRVELPDNLASFRNSQIVYSSPDATHNTMANSYQFYGPIIKHKGANWFKPGTTPEEKQYIDIQPICYIRNVALTPMAALLANKAITFLHQNRSNFLSQSPTKDNLQQFGIQSGSETSNFLSNIGAIGNAYAEYANSGAYTDSTSKPDSVFSLESYSSFLQIENTKEARLKFYNEHPELFTKIKDEKTGVTEIIGPQGLKWGEIDSNGNTSFFDNDKISSVTREDLEKNIHKVDEHNSREFAKTNNIISYDDQVNYLAKTGSARIENYNKVTGWSSSYSTGDSLSFTAEGKNISVPVVIGLDSSGNRVYTIRKQDLNKQGVGLALPGDITGSSFDDLKNKLAEASSQGEQRPLFKDTYEQAGVETYTNLFVQEFDYFVKLGMKLVTAQKGKDKVTETLPIYNPEGQTYTQSIEKTYWKATFTLEGGQTTITRGGQYNKELSVFYEKVNLPNFMRDVNKEIELRRSGSEMSAEEKDEAFKPLAEQYGKLAALASSGGMRYITLDNGYLTNSLGQVFGKKNADGTITGLGREEAEKHMIDTFNSDPDMKSAYYKAVLGDKLVQENGKTYYVNGNTRVEINTSADINTFRSTGLNALRMGDLNSNTLQKRTESGWVTVSSSEEMGKLSSDMTNTMNSVGSTTMNKEVMDIYRQKILDAIANTRNQSRQQYYEAKRQTSQQKGIYEILKAMAEVQLEQSGKWDELSKKLSNLESDTNKEILVGKALERFRTQAGDTWKDLEFGTTSFGQNLVFDKDLVSSDGKETTMKVYGTNSDGTSFIAKDAKVKKVGDTYYITAGGTTYTVTNMNQSANDAYVAYNGTASPQNAGTSD